VSVKTLLCACMCVDRLTGRQQPREIHPRKLESKIYCIGSIAYESLHYNKQQLRQTCQFQVDVVLFSVRVSLSFMPLQ